MWRAMLSCFFFSSRRRHTRWPRDWSSDVCSSDLATQLDAVGVPQSDLVLGESQARDGQDLLGKHFPGGSGSPANVVVEQDKLQDVADALLKNDGIDGVSVMAAEDRKSTRLNSSHVAISYAVFCLKKKT